MKPAPPKRLLDDPQAPAQLRDDLRASADARVDYDTSAGLASLQAALALPAAPPPAQPAAPGAEHALREAVQSQAPGAVAGSGAGAVLGGATATKLALGALGAAALIAGGAAVVWPKTAPASQPVPSVQHAPATTQSPAAPPAPGAQPATGHTLDAAQTGLPDDPDALAPAPIAAPRELAAPRDPDGRLRREVAQLARIKTLLAHDPRQAYRLAQAGNREFARGAVAQEREGLAVLALSALGREREAARRAQALLERYPSSPLRERLTPIAQGQASPRDL